MKRKKYTRNKKRDTKRKHKKRKRKTIRKKRYEYKRITRLGKKWIKQMEIFMKKL